MEKREYRLTNWEDVVLPYGYMAADTAPDLSDESRLCDEICEAWRITVYARGEWRSLYFRSKAELEIWCAIRGYEVCAASMYFVISRDKISKIKYAEAGDAV